VRATVALVQAPSDLFPTVLAELPAGADLAVFCGTVPLLSGDFRYATDCRMELGSGGATIRSEYSLTTA